MKYFEFQYPIILLLIPLLGFLFYLVWRKETSNKQTISHSHLKKDKGFANWKVKYQLLPDVLKYLSICLFVVVIARPRVVSVKESVKGNGIDIVIAMDISTSMLAMDFKPDRITASKELAIDFVNKRSSDKIGLVVFGGESFTQCPLTVDHEILNSFIKSQQVGYLAEGTAVGMGLATAVNRMKGSNSKSKVVILLTDGVNNAGYIDPLYAAKLAQEFGVKVYCIGMGSDEVTTIPNGVDMDGNIVYARTRGELDEDMMNEISNQTGGKYFRARNAEELKDIYALIDKMEKNEFELDVLKRYKEWYRPFAFAAFLSLLLSIVMSTFFIKKLN